MIKRRQLFKTNLNIFAIRHVSLIMTIRGHGESPCIMYMIHWSFVRACVCACRIERRHEWPRWRRRRWGRLRMPCVQPVAGWMARLWSPSRTALTPNFQPPQSVHERYINVTLLFIILLLSTSLWRERVVAVVIIVQRIRLRERPTRLTDG